MPAPKPLISRAQHRSWYLRDAFLAAAALLLATGLASLPTPAFAASNTPAASEPASAPAPMARSYLPKPTETLDQVIARTLPESPLKIELLRQAFIAQNPQAITPGKVPKLRKGVPLVVPDHDALVRIHLGRLAPPVEVAPPKTAPFAHSTSDERKRWVQFP